MKINPITKRIFKSLALKMIGLENHLPKDEKESVAYIASLCRSWNHKNAVIDPEKYFVTQSMYSDKDQQDVDFGLEEFIKLNDALLFTIWLSENTYDNILQIEALENIVREYHKNSEVNDYMESGEDIVSTLQMLVRTYAEHPDCPNGLILTALKEFDDLLGDGEELAFGDESLNYLAMRGEFGGLIEISNKLMELPKGSYSDCYACIVNRLIRWHILNENYETASLLIDKVFYDKLSCDLIPNSTYVQKLLVAKMLDRQDCDFKKLEKAAVKNLTARDVMVYEAYFLLLYSSHTKNLDLANKVIEQFEGVIEAISSPEKVYYCLAAYQVTGDKFFYESGIELARRFDVRNQNAFYVPMFG